MKRFLCFTLCLLCIILSMSSCQKEESEGLAPYRANNMEMLFEDLAGAYYANVDDVQVETEEYLLTHDTGTEAKPFLVPIVYSDQYTFDSFEAYPDRYCYCYKHVDAPGDSLDLDPLNFEIHISIDKKDNFFLGIEKNEEFIMLSSNTARYKDENWWYFESAEGGCIEVMFPDSIVIESSDDVWEYVSFEQYVVDDEGVHKLSEFINGDDYQ